MTSKQIGSSMKSVGEVRIPLWLKNVLISEICQIQTPKKLLSVLEGVSFHGFGDIENYLLQKSIQVTFYLLIL